MKTTNFSFCRRRAFYIAALLLLGLLAISNGQEGQPRNTEDFRIRIAVEEVRIDTVVLDKKTRKPVTDLTAKDFEIFQNDLPREIVSCKYIAEQTESSGTPGIASAESPKPDKKSKKIPSIPFSKLEPEDVRRVIVFVVDDLSMDFENMHNARMGLKKWVEQQMSPGDLVAVLRTSYGNSAIQIFLSDKKQLLARIDTIEWGRNAGRIVSEDTLQPLYEGQISTIKYGIKALKDMPGRKALVVMTAQPELSSGMSFGTENAVNYQFTYEGQIKRLADDALRAGVVIHVLDIRGLEAPNNDTLTVNSGSMTMASPVSLTPSAGMMGGMGGMGGIAGMMGGSGGYSRGSSGGGGTTPTGAGNNFHPPTAIGSNGGMSGIGNVPGMPGSGSFGGMRGGFSFTRQPATQNSLPAKTGGLFIENQNFFLNGIGDVNNTLKGYYLISFIPAPNSFKSNRQAVYHRIKINVKRGGVEWHTRDGFYGTTEAAPMNEAASVPNAMRDAIYSPFQNHELRLSLASGYVNNPASGYMLRSWLHLNAKDLQLVKKDEGYSVSLTAVCLASDIKGYIHDSNMMKFEFGIKDENLQWIKENGIRFSLLLPIKQPGAYYLRVAIKDEASGKVGSAYEFVDIPDLSKGRLAMSNMFIINTPDDTSWVWSGKTEEASRRLLAPVLKREENKTPALREYKPGETLEYMTIVYNAKLHGNVPDLETQYFLFKDGKQIKNGEPQKVDTSGLNEFKRIPIGKKLIFADDMQDGNYVLQLVVSDKQEKGQSGLVAQTLDFQIKAK
jgi:VWFA-related protein